MKKVYFISGLGADQRVFGFLDLSFCEPIFIDWIPPLKKESLKDYALRLREKITGKDPVVVGISFGGMLATEMAKADPSIRAIIISSSKINKSFPAYFKLGKYLPLYEWLPASLMKRASLILRYKFGAKGTQQKKILRQVIVDTDAVFSKWAITSILHWRNDKAPSNVIHIHGTADKILPYKLSGADHLIEGGTHLMIMDKYEELSALLKKIDPWVSMRFPYWACKLFMRISFVFIWLLYSLPGHANDSLSYHIRINFLYGSKPAKGFKKTESKLFGGLKGGHVNIEAGGRVLDFVPGDNPLLPKNKKPSGGFHLNHSVYWDTSSTKWATVYIPVSREQYGQLQFLFDSFSVKAPYDYAILGMRCAAASYDVLSRIGLFKELSVGNNVSRHFYPKLLRKKIIKWARKNNYVITNKQGRSSRKWESDKGLF